MPDLLDPPLDDSPSATQAAGSTRAHGTRRERLTAHALAAEVARRHGEALLRTARRVSRNADDAHDAYQRALELLLSHATTIETGKAVAWMHVVVRREALAIRSAHGPSVISLDAEDVDVELRGLADHGDDRVHAIDLAQRAGEALANLKDAEAQALCLRAQGMSYEEIGELNGWSYTKLHRSLPTRYRHSGPRCVRRTGLLDRRVRPASRLAGALL